IGVYDPFKKDKEKVYKMMRHHRIRYYAPADYSNGSKLDTLVKQIIRKTAAYEVLEGEYIHCKYEAEE
ncbi:MAG: haloacid dehalogenase-like hydrolase, partial [Veillonella sp.]|nr:haloacid dehalogenase-like hydrolase [Veillonella sp.]